MKRQVIFIDTESGELVETTLSTMHTETRVLRQYIVTHHSWEDIDSLGVTRHHEDESIYFEHIYAESRNLARASYARENNIPYIEVRAKLIK